ncbi:MAG: dynamin family protein [Gammaproteobacteria bacterium]|nr:dynamin family protein [Gammaproteobacteria bacterium]
MSENLLSSVQQFGAWRKNLVSSINGFQKWLEVTELDDSEQSLKIYDILQALKHDKLILAFVGEFSRGKTELINSIFFSKYKKRLLPSEAGRTTMCPTDLFYDEDSKPFLKLLPIETRLEGLSLAEYRKALNHWIHIDLDDNSSEKMMEAFSKITDTQQVTVEQAKKLGLDDAIKDDEGNLKSLDTLVEIPTWRQALVNFHHPFLEQGLTILDTPGLNSLGNEPELTLSMLPKAQAVVFVLSADTGVTRSDMGIWQEALRNFRRKKTKDGLIVALNKIDTLWDELKNQDDIDRVIATQREDTATTLAIDKQQVIAVSAQKALLARVKNDDELFTKSNLAAIENILATKIIPQKEKILKNTLLSDLKDMMVNDKNIILGKFKSVKKQVDELAALKGKNEDIVVKLRKKTDIEQKKYNNSNAVMTDSQKKVKQQFDQLNQIISLEKLDNLVSSTRDSMKGSWTTPGLKNAMKIFFDGVQDITEDANKGIELANRLISSVYTRFGEESGYEKLNAPGFSIKKHVEDMVKLHLEAEDYRNSSLTTMTEQSFVIKSFFITLVSQARNIFFIMNKEASEWQKTALSPLNKQLKSHKNEVTKRLDQLKKISESKESIEEQGKRIKQTAVLYFNQVKEVDQMIATMEGKKVEGKKVEGKKAESNKAQEPKAENKTETAS